MHEIPGLKKKFRKAKDLILKVMTYLIDTHVLIWWLEDQQKLSKVAHEIISIPTNEIVVSAASLWEMAIKTRLGKLRTPNDPIERIREEAFTLLDIQPIHAWNVRNIPTHHQDPFDHLLIAQAIHENLPIITRDQFFDLYPIKIIW